MDNGKLRHKTLELLRNRPENMLLKHIADATNLPLTWIKSFNLNGHIHDSGSDKVVSLYEYLSGKKLKI